MFRAYIYVPECGNAPIIVECNRFAPVVEIVLLHTDRLYATITKGDTDEVLIEWKYKKIIWRGL